MVTVKVGYMYILNINSSNYSNIHIKHVPNIWCRNWKHIKALHKLIWKPIIQNISIKKSSSIRTFSALILFLKRTLLCWRKYTKCKQYYLTTTTAPADCSRLKGRQFRMHILDDFPYLSYKYPRYRYNTHD
jgi:hypothetical protein